MSAADASPVVLRRIAEPGPADIRGLAELLVDCVEGGASVSFMSPLDVPRAERFWQRVAEGVVRGERVLVVAEDATGIVGTVQLVLDLPENQPHRADVSKMLVRTAARRRGIGELLMREAERAAADHGRSVLVLDTASAAAERLYERCGWQRAGSVPDFALLPGGGYCDTTFFHKRLAGHPRA